MPKRRSDQVLLGLAVKQLRSDRGVTQEELSRRSGVHPTYISDVERGARNPSWASVVKLTDALEAPVAELAAAYDRLRTK